MREVDMSKVDVVISVDDDHIDQIYQVVESLQSLGMDIEQALSIGVISGSISRDQLSRLNQVQGVKDVETERSYQLPPPNSEIQ